jgi:DNA polymerase IV
MAAAHADEEADVTLLLIDMDAFFASVEQAHHPRLRGLPVIVCGDPSRRGVVTAASYEARPFGVRAGMPLAEARRLCPHAEYVEGDPDKYVSTSLKLLELYLEHTPDVEPFSVDEAFVGLRGRDDSLEAGERLARELQRLILERFGLSASIGVGPNKLVAKMASGVAKPRGLTVLDLDRFRATFWPRDVQELWGVGPKLADRLRALGVSTVGALARAPLPMLKGAFGVVGEHLREAAAGHDATPLVPYHEGIDPRSMGHEVTLSEDCDDPAFLEGLVLRLSDQVARRLRSEGFVGTTVTLKLRDHRFHTITRQRVVSPATDDGARVNAVARDLLRANWRGTEVRLLGVSVAGLEPRPDAPQAELFATDERARALTRALDEVRDRLGEAAVVPAGSLTHRRRLGHVPFGALKPPARDAAREGPARGPRDDASGRGTPRRPKRAP